jgi:hypothetical protein
VPGTWSIAYAKIIRTGLQVAIISGKGGNQIRRGAAIGACTHMQRRGYRRAFVNPIADGSPAAVHEAMTEVVNATLPVPSKLATDSGINNGL